MAPCLPRRSSVLPRFPAIALAVSCALASAGADAGCSLTRTASNEITLRFGSECTSDTALQSRVKSDLLGAVSEQPAAGAAGAAAGPTDSTSTRHPSGKQNRRSPTSISSLTPSQKRLYALDQVRLERDMWWRRTFTPFAYYGQSSR
jgi:hypothetical protein